MIGVGWTIDTVNFWGGFIRILFPFNMGMLLARTFKPRKVKGAFIFPVLVWLGACGSGSGVTSKANRFLGDLSYPLYIVHYPITYIFYAWLIKNDIYTLGDCWPMALLVIASSVALAYICLKFYGEPVRRWLSQDKTLKQLIEIIPL